MGTLATGTCWPPKLYCLAILRWRVIRIEPCLGVSPKIRLGEREAARRCPGNKGGIAVIEGIAGGITLPLLRLYACGNLALATAMALGSWAK